MEEKEMRISISELIEIIAYSLGEEYSQKLQRHWRKYHDWKRIKDTIIKDLILERKDAREKNKRLQAKLDQIEPLLQKELFYPRSTEGSQMTPQTSLGV